MIFLQSLENVLFTLKKVNENQNFLPGIELVLKTKEDCVIDSRALSLVNMSGLDIFCVNLIAKRHLRGLLLYQEE